MKAVRVLVVGAMLLLLGGGAPAFASSPHSGLSLTLNGAIFDSGSQSYYHTGGHLVEAVIGGVPVEAFHANLHYSLQAEVSELTVSGWASFSLVGQNPHGSQLVVNGSAELDGMIPAETFPLGCTFGSDCTSAIPGMFIGEANVMVQECQGNADAGRCDVLLTETVPMSFESAFLNPFGGPIFMASSDEAIFIVADYSQSRVTWAGIQLGGTMAGSLAGGPVAGSFLMTVSATEDLRAGYELDHGSIVFVSDNPAVNAEGEFVGRSTIPAGVPCPAGLDFPEGTCQITGFESAGVFSQTNSLGEMIAGDYSTVWTSPAVAFTSTVQATVK